MMNINNLKSAHKYLSDQLLNLGLGGNVVAHRPTISVAAAVASAGRNVHAVGIGKKVTEDKKGKEDCVRIYVVQKLPLSLLSPRDVIPKMLDGVPTDIIEAEPPFVYRTKQNTSTKKRRARKTQLPKAAVSACSNKRRDRRRPLIGGVSAGHRDITAGTLGCFCKSTDPRDDANQLFALSNNHVFANVNKALNGDPLYQPGPADGGEFQDYFAKLKRYVHMRLGGHLSNRVDAAIGELIANDPVNTEICSVGNVTGTMLAEDDMLVRKHGRTSGYTEGKIDDINYSGLVGMDHNDPTIVAKFDDQLRIIAEGATPFGLGGDSGSAVIHRTESKIIGLYFAGPTHGMYGLANRIEHVFEELEISNCIMDENDKFELLTICKAQDLLEAELLGKYDVHGIGAKPSKNMLRVYAGSKSRELMHVIQEVKEKYLPFSIELILDEKPAIHWDNSFKSDE